MSFADIIKILVLFAWLCNAQQASIQNNEQSLNFDYSHFDLKENDANGNVQLQGCNTLIDTNGDDAMCNGATWWMRDQWDDKRTENQALNAAVFNETEIINNTANLNSGWPKKADGGRLHLAGQCYEKPGKYLKIPGSRNQARWFKSKTVGQSCREVCADASASTDHFNGEILAFDPVSMPHGGPKDGQDYFGAIVLTHSHMVTSILEPTYTHTYINANGYPLDQYHQTHEVGVLNAVDGSWTSFGANGHGPFTSGCFIADDFGEQIADYRSGPGNGLYKDAFSGCMNWEGDIDGSIVFDGFAMCTCRDSFIESDGTARPIDVHDNSTKYGRKRLIEANEWYNISRLQKLDWNVKIEPNHHPSGYDSYRYTLEDGVGRGLPPEAIFPVHQKIVSGAPAPELQLAYYCECPKGTHGKNCEITTDYCNHDHDLLHPYAKCDPEHTHSCLHINNSTNGGAYRHCQCNAGWIGPTCATQDECSIVHGHKCIHGTCLYGKVSDTIFPYDHPPRMDYTSCGACSQNVFQIQTRKN
jgi:hypothetical protein